MASEVGPMLTAAASSFFGGMARQGGQRAAGYAVDKVLGIPNPSPKTGAALGADMKAYQDTAFPGTNPWERLGGSGYPGGAVEAAKQSGKVQKEMQSKELATRVQVANIGAAAHVQSSATQLGPRAVRSARATQQGFRTPEYETPALGKIKQETRTEIARTAVEGSRAELERALAKLAPEFASAKLTAEQTRNNLAAILNAMKEIEKGDGKIATSIGVKGAMGAAGTVALARIPIVRNFMRRFGAKYPTSKPITGKLRSGRPQMNPQKIPNKAPPYPGKGKLSKKAIKAIKP